MCAGLCTPVLRTGGAGTSAHLQWNELALAEFVSRPGNPVGDILDPRSRLYDIGCPPSFRQQGADDPGVWSHKFQIRRARDRFWWSQ